MAGDELDARAAVSDRIFQSMLAGEPDPATFAEDVTYEQHFGNMAGVYHGLSGLQRWCREFTEIWAEPVGRMDRFREADESVIADFSVIVAGRQSGVEVELRGTAVYRFGADGRVLRFDTYNDKAEVRAALEDA